MLMARRVWNFDGWLFLDASAKRFWSGEEKAGIDIHCPAIVH
jgi:hypothetical protein